MHLFPCHATSVRETTIYLAYKIDWCVQLWHHAVTCGIALALCKLGEALNANNDE